MVFLGQHGGELGAFPAAAGALGAALSRYGLLALPGAGQSAAGALAAALVAVAWYGLGAGLLRLTEWAASGERPVAGGSSSRALHVARACALGAGGWSLVWCALGVAGLYRTASALAALALGLALAVIAATRARARPAGAAEAGPGATGSSLAPLLAMLVVIPAALALAGALAPPTAKDTLQYHLALPRAFLAGGGLVAVPGNMAAYFPLGAEMHGVWAVLLGRVVSDRAGEAAFGAVAFAFFPLLLLAVFGWARERDLPRDWAWLAAAMVAGVPTVVEVAGSGYVDVPLALYVTLATRAGARWWTTRGRACLIEAALALGFAAAIKLTAGFAVLFFVLLVLARGLAPSLGRGAARAALVPGMVAIVGALVVGSGWYVRTWALTGSPVFPFFADVWPGQAPGWDAERSALLHAFNALYGGADKGWLDYLLTPLWLSVTGQREVAAAFEGVLGVSFIVGAALVIWALGRGGLDPELEVAAAAAGVFFACWLVSAQVLRYLLPALPSLAVASAGAGAALVAGGAVGPALRWALVGPVVAGEIVAVAWFVADDPLLAATGAEPRDAYLERRLDYYPYYRLINRSLPAEVTIWLVDMRRDTYYLERPYAGDYLFEDYTLRKWVGAAATGAEVRERARAAGITHVLIRHDILFDYARSPLVDDARPRADNLARLERLRAFLADGTRVLRSDAKFALVDLAPR